jgi:hypothetical protein
MALALFKFNLLGLASAFLLFYTVLSNNPWWTVYGGVGDERTFSAEVSPFNISVEVLGKPVIVPILFYLTMAARLSILLAAVTTLSGSLLAQKAVVKATHKPKGTHVASTLLGRSFRNVKSSCVIRKRKPTANRAVYYKVYNRLRRTQDRHGNGCRGGAYPRVLDCADSRSAVRSSQGLPRQDSSRSALNGSLV